MNCLIVSLYLLLITGTDSEGPNKIAHLCSLVRALATPIPCVEVRGMSLKFVDSLSTAQHKQLLVFSAISSYSVLYQECICEK